MDENWGIGGVFGADNESEKQLSPMSLVGG